MYLFRATAGLDSFYFRDRISICLNISGTGLYYNGDNPTAAESAFISIALALAAGDATVLGCADVSMV